MDLSQVLFILMVGILSLDFVIERGLSFLNLKRWSSKIPDIVKPYYSPEKYKTAMSYSLAKSKLSWIEDILGFALVLSVLFFDGIAIVDSYSRTLTEQPIILALLFFGIAFIVSDVLGLPFSIYQTFSIEERFGFNKSTPKVFVFDKLKSYLLTILLGGGVLSLFVYLFETFGSLFWILAWLFVGVFSIVMSMFYSQLIVPLFNKQEPLPTGELRDAIEAFASKVGFHIDHIYVINGSKRSTKANAYFTGFWKKKRIVLYDTLIQDHSVEELVAVLAHEIGHYKLKHTVQQLVIGLLQMGFMLFVMGLFLDTEGDFAIAVAKALNVEPSFHIGLIAFGILFSPISSITGVIGNILSRKNEYAADNFAKENGNQESLEEALIKLSKNNLSNLNPHPLFVWFHYSHPTLIQRIQAMRNKDS